jgi:hypothetical protein
MSDFLRRDFLGGSATLLGALASQAVLGPTAWAAKQDSRIWQSALVLVGQSEADQEPSTSIRCPLYFTNGQYANASHGLDLGTFPVRGDITWNGATIVPNLGESLAVSDAAGTDGHLYLLVGAEGSVSDGSGIFAKVSRAIVRCKYKIAPSAGTPLLVACSYCMVVLVRR